MMCWTNVLTDYHSTSFRPEVFSSVENFWDQLSCIPDFSQLLGSQGDLNFQSSCSLYPLSNPSECVCLVCKFLGWNPGLRCMLGKLLLTWWAICLGVRTSLRGECKYGFCLDLWIAKCLTGAYWGVWRKWEELCMLCEHQTGPLPLSPLRWVGKIVGTQLPLSSGTVVPCCLSQCWTLETLA